MFGLHRPELVPVRFDVCKSDVRETCLCVKVVQETLQAEPPSVNRTTKGLWIPEVPALSYGSAWTINQFLLIFHARGTIERPLGSLREGYLMV
jgi:hypothetical protein